MAEGSRVISTRSTSARPVIQDFAIIGGAVLTNVLFDRLIRPHFNKFMIGLFRNVYRVYPHLVRARNRIVHLYFSTRRAANITDRYIRDKTIELIHGVTLRVYPFLYNRVERIYVWMRERRLRGIGNDRADDVLPPPPPRQTRLHRHLERASFRYIPDIDEGELDDVNEDGLIEAYERSESTSDTEDEVEDLETEVDESEAVSDRNSRWGISNVTSFDPSKKKGRCSTPVKLTFPKETMEDSSQLQQSEAKVAALEYQLNEMKAMIALILENQNKTLMSDKTIAPTPAPAPTVSAPASAPPGPPPPPPPPPPMPAMQLSASSTQIKLRVGRKSGNDDCAAAKQTKAEPEVKSMADVLKGLSTVKLRPTERSPGGTPMKRPKRFSANDPNSVLEQVLLRRFARMHSPMSDNEQDEDRRRSNSNKENDDSFDNSPKPSAAVQSKAFPGARRSSLASTTEAGAEDLRATAIPEENESALSLDENTPKAPNSPKFGQYLLKPANTNANAAKKNLSSVLRQSSSKSPLREQSQNSTMNANYM